MCFHRNPVRRLSHHSVKCPESVTDCVTKGHVLNENFEVKILEVGDFKERFRSREIPLRVTGVRCTVEGVTMEFRT